MRTTLILRDDLVEVAKKKAAERKTTLSAIVDEALMMSLHANPFPGDQENVCLPIYSPPRATSVDTGPEEIHELMVAEDMELYGKEDGLPRTRPMGTLQSFVSENGLPGKAGGGCPSCRNRN
jgi:hypothetical protein